jgi:hypothetical protein
MAADDMAIEGRQATAAPFAIDVGLTHLQQDDGYSKTLCTSVGWLQRACYSTGPSAIRPVDESHRPAPARPQAGASHPPGRVLASVILRGTGPTALVRCKRGRLSTGGSPLSRSTRRPEGNGAFKKPHVAMVVATFLFIPASVGTPLLAESLIFNCKWQEASPPYSAEFRINVDDGTATRSDSDAKYSILAVSEEAVWLKQRETSGQMIAIATFSRSDEGGAWTDTQLLADGRASQISGGYCVERLQ